MKMINPIAFMFSLIILFFDNVEPADVDPGFAILRLKYARARCFKITSVFFASMSLMSETFKNPAKLSRPTSALRCD